MQSTSTWTGPEDLYGILLESSHSPFVQGIIFAWWPLSKDWGWKELVQCSTECLPAVRPGLDLIALPSVPEVHELWECWIQEHGLNSHQVLWFSPRLGASAADDPALEVGREVLSSIVARKAAPQQPILMDQVCLYPAFVTASLAAEATSAGVPVVGNFDGSPHKVVDGEPCGHPHSLDDAEGPMPVLDDTLLPQMNGMRVRRAYVAGSSESLHKAWQRLQQECSTDSQFLLRPVGEHGHLGSVPVSEEKDLDAVAFQSMGSYAVLEESVACADQQGFLTLHMFGGEPCTWQCGQDLPVCCIEAAWHISEILMLKDHWSIDFARDSTGMLIIMDIFKSRPFQNSSVQLWASRARHSLALSMVECGIPAACAPSAKEIMNLLQSANLLWDGDEGIIVYQYAPGAILSLAIASSFGGGAVDVMHAEFSKLMFGNFGLAVK